ncbi:hypothetical protein B0J13DRAFT_456847 [Dactylonectria estremocensis]|uniref:C2H2-type domain-containing protein n=1 Tax=Dactylonectria estremocensis TaxID=1079267 RepID=A0A9P9IH30_9HYPO|nr:hypothetical protein B0J13DRAFT_456847 [Dactylonectria estremocensis]
MAPQPWHNEPVVGIHLVPYEPSLSYDSAEDRSNNESTLTKVRSSGHQRTLPIRNRRRQTSATSGSSSNTHGCLTPPSSEDELNESPSDGESDAENLYSDGEHHVDTALQEYTLSEHHLFHKLRQRLFETARENAQTWIANGPRFGIQCKNRGRMADCLPRSTKPGAEEDTNDQSDNQNFRWACPFYASDPNKYQQCLMHDLQSTEEVKVHLRRHHLKPPYCPRCYHTFATVVDRDGHILESKCELVEPRHVDGINHYQKSRLVNMDSGGFDDVEYWRCIWAIVFPSLKPANHYLTKGRGLASSLVRDYWSMYGQRCVSQYLETRALLLMGDERAQVALRKLILDDLIRDIMEGCWLA